MTKKHRRSQHSLCLEPLPLCLARGLRDLHQRAGNHRHVCRFHPGHAHTPVSCKVDAVLVQHLVHLLGAKGCQDMSASESWYR